MLNKKKSQLSHRLILVVVFFLLQSDETDVSQFDTRFTAQPPVDSPDDSALSESANRVFAVSSRFHL